MGDAELAEPPVVSGWAGVAAECEWRALVVCPCGAFREGRNAVAEGAAILQLGFS